jgi:hypothetical protein
MCELKPGVTAILMNCAVVLGGFGGDFVSGRGFAY